MKKKSWIYISVIVVLVASAVLFYFQNKELAGKYSEAVALAEEGKFEEAREMMYNIGEYKNSEVLADEYNNEVGYITAMEHYQKGEYAQALEIFESLASVEGGGFKDSVEKQNEVGYKRGIQLAKDGNINEARVEFKKLPLSYGDVKMRIEQLNYLKNFIDLWYCSTHQIDMDIKGYLSEDNISYLNIEIKDRNGFLLGTENNKLIGENIVLDEDRFVWNMFGDEVKYVGQMTDNELNVSKLGEVEDVNIVNFVRKFESYSEVDGDLNASVNRDVDAGVK